jgi:hypothetical protein
VQGHAQGHVETTGVLCGGNNSFSRSMQPLTNFSSVVAAVDKPSGVCGGQRIRPDYEQTGNTRKHDQSDFVEKRTTVCMTCYESETADLALTFKSVLTATNLSVFRFVLVS